MVRDARAFRLPEDAIAGIAGAISQREPSFDGLWPENVAIVAAFLAAATQWRVASTGGGMVPAQLRVIGFDYAGARVGIEAAGIAITPELWAGLRVMEAEAVRVLNEADG